MHGAQMRGETDLRYIPLSACITCMTLLTSVRSVVLCEVVLACKGLTAYTAHIRLFTSMRSQMDNEIALHMEPLLAYIACMGLLSGMR